ncbi:MAG: TraR/DksA family transcriptional regulator [Xanthomonadales bacterium]|nr:TraR/DksA family transcriptional regulator [Xanthomonadales bacterium]
MNRLPLQRIDLSEIIVEQGASSYGVKDSQRSRTQRRIFMLNQEQLREFKKILDKRYYDLREEIRAELLESDDEHYIDLAGQVHDLEEQSVADLLVDLDLAIIDLHIDEIREIDAALMRIASGDYGICQKCGDDIEPERLRVHPTAKRCRPCQAVHESTHAGNRTPSI